MELIFSFCTGTANSRKRINTAEAKVRGRGGERGGGKVANLIFFSAGRRGAVQWAITRKGKDARTKVKWGGGGKGKGEGHTDFLFPAVQSTKGMT